MISPEPNGLSAAEKLLFALALFIFAALLIFPLG